MNLILAIIIFICPYCGPKGDVSIDLTFSDPQGNKRTQAAIGDVLTKNIEVCNYPTGNPGIVENAVVTVSQPTGINFLSSPNLNVGTLDIDECKTISIDVEVVDEYWLIQPCEVSVTGTTGNGVVTSDEDIEPLYESKPVACHEWLADGTLIQQYIKLPSNELIPDGEPFIMQVFCGGVLSETVTGDLGTGNYSSDDPNGILVGATGDFGNGQTFKIDPTFFAGCTDFRTELVVGGNYCETISEIDEGVIN